MNLIPLDQLDSHDCKPIENFNSCCIFDIPDDSWTVWQHNNQKAVYWDKAHNGEIVCLLDRAELASGLTNDNTYEQQISEIIQKEAIDAGFPKHHPVDIPWENDIDTIINSLIHGGQYISKHGDILYAYYAFNDKDQNHDTNQDNPYACYIGNTNVQHLAQFLNEQPDDELDITDAIHSINHIIYLYQELNYDNPHALSILKDFIKAHKPWVYASNNNIRLLTQQTSDESTPSETPLENTMSHEFKNVCPVCANEVQAKATYNEYGHKIERRLRCPECGTIWLELFVPANQHIVQYGNPKPKEPETVTEAVEQMLAWAYNDAFVRFDEPPRLTCDEILTDLNSFAKTIIAASYAQKE